jgi:DNA (cytosine-5)-methyltransferase 1
METILRAMGEVVQIATAYVRQMNGRTTRTHIDLFSGIGGFALACRWAGIETIAFCEIEPYAQRVLRKNFPGIRIFEDVRQFPATEFREPFLLTGGYPCQPFSQAGKRRGAEDDRHLWPSMFGIIRTSRPTWILAENVAGHVTLGLDEVLADLESEEYAVQPIIVPACAVDAPHRRDRIWILANAKRDSGNASREIAMGDATSKLGDECGEYRETSRRQIPEPRNASCEISFADSNNARRVKQWRTKSIQSELVTAECDCRDVANANDSRKKPSRNDRRVLRKQKPIENTRNDDFKGWSAEPNLGRVAHGIPRRVDRLRGLGNAIVPQVAYEIIKAMIEADESA